MDKLKVGVIGVGHLGKLHIKMFLQMNNCELIGIYDSDIQKTEECNKEFGVKVFYNIDDLIKNVDAISIATSTSSHYEVAKLCLENGINIFIEKPITVTLAEAEEIVSIANKNNLKLQVGHIERFNPALLAIEKYINNPMFIQTDRLSQFNPRGTDVAVVLDLMIHDIDIILNLIKSDVKQIYASGVPVVSDSIDIANARIEFQNGAVANVTASRISQKKMRKMRIFQKDTYISLDFITGVSEVYRLINANEDLSIPHISFGEIGIGEKKRRIIYEQPEIIEINALLYELQLFVNAVLNNTKPVVSGEDGLRALKVADEIINKIDESIKNAKLR